MTIFFALFQKEKDSIIKLIGGFTSYGIHAGAVILGDDLSRYQIGKDSKLGLPVIHVENWEEVMKIEIFELDILKEANKKGIDADFDITNLESPEIFGKLTNLVKNKTSNEKYFQWQYNHKLLELLGIKEVNSIEDLTKINALFRPGALSEYNYHLYNEKYPEGSKRIFQIQMDGLFLERIL